MDTFVKYGKNELPEKMKLKNTEDVQNRSSNFECRGVHILSRIQQITFSVDSIGHIFSRIVLEGTVTIQCDKCLHGYESPKDQNINHFGPKGFNHMYNRSLNVRVSSLNFPTCRIVHSTRLLGVAKAWRTRCAGIWGILCTSLVFSPRPQTATMSST